MSSACVWWGTPLVWVTGDVYACTRAHARTYARGSAVTRSGTAGCAYTKHYNNKWAAPGGVLHNIFTHTVNVHCRCDDITVAAESNHTTLDSPRAQW